ncbi:MAG: hypothetical protein MUF18_09980 [Fimbriiglobus sp.]|jgi:hypothetical protein|nr:hypothetical protein [Fimbriiglobus sp.]
MWRLVLLMLPALAACGCNFTINVPKKSTPTTADTTPTVDDRNTNYRADQSALRNAKRAGERLAQMTDFQAVQLFIFEYELNNNRMPTVAEVQQSLKSQADTQHILKKIEEGVIILTGTANKNSLWAYEVDADKAGGIVCLGPSGSIRRATADEVKQYMAIR